MADVFYAGQKDYIFRLNKMASDLQAAFTQVQADWNATSGPTVIQNKPTFAQVAYTGAYADLTGKPVLAAVATSGLKADVGLGNVDNTSDANKPVSSATQTALDLKTTASVLAASGGGALVGNNPAGNIAATTVQAALNELDAEKAKLNGDITQSFSGSTITATTINATTATSTNLTATNTTFSNLNGGQLAGMRNRIVNGNIRINQFGSTNGSADGLVVSDMWVYSNSLGALINIASISSGSSVSASGGGNLTLQCITAKTTLAAGDYAGVVQNIEGYNVGDFSFGTAAAKTGIISFRASATVANTVIAISIRNAATNRSYVTTVTLSTAPANYSVAIPGDTSGTWAKDTTAGMVIAFYGLTGTTFQAPSLNTWATGNYVSHSSCSNILSVANRAFSITDIQLEMGTVATPYEQRTFSTEMAICQRYYCEITAANGQAISATTMFAIVTLPAMRAAPTVVALTAGTVTNATGTPSAVTNVSTQFAGAQTTGLFVTTTGLTAGNAAVLYNARFAFISRP